MDSCQAPQHQHTQYQQHGQATHHTPPVHITTTTNHTTDTTPPCLPSTVILGMRLSHFFHRVCTVWQVQDLKQALLLQAEERREMEDTHFTLQVHTGAPATDIIMLCTSA